MRKIKNIWLILLLLINIIVKGQSTLDIEKLDDAVGVLICYDNLGNAIGHGSCFVIDADGILVTNYHVLEDVYSAKIKLESGTYSLNKIISGNKAIDLIKFSIIKNYAKQKFSSVKIASLLPKKGEDAWAIGTPFDPALMNTVSKGLIANIFLGQIRREIQTNAEITHGSSGGALFNSKGEVIGVTSSGIDNSGANLNFAIWIGEINNLNYLNVDRIYNDALIPVKVSFYKTFPSFKEDVSLYIDGRYIGTFSSYFNQSAPICGQAGTITTYLSKGYHKFYAYEQSTGGSWNGDFTINTNDCFLQGLTKNEINRASIPPAQTEESREMNCYNKWCQKFDERGAEEVEDGIYTDVIITSRIGSKANCWNGKAEVRNKKLVKCYIIKEDNTYEEVMRTWRRNSNKEVTIINGISTSMITIHYELINVLWPNKIKPKKAAATKAPEPSND